MDFDLLTAVVQPGDIIRVDRNYFVLVITKDRHQGYGFYYCRCDFDGNIIKQYGDNTSAANYINHSNMILVGDRTDKCDIVNCITLESRTVFHNCQKYTWQLTGDRAIDAYMSNLDERWSLFCDTCNDIQRAKYAQLEDLNHHEENGYFVKLHAEFFRREKLDRLNPKRGVT